MQHLGLPRAAVGMVLLPVGFDQYAAHRHQIALQVQHLRGLGFRDKSTSAPFSLYIHVSPRYQVALSEFSIFSVPGLVLRMQLRKYLEWSLGSYTGIRWPSKFSNCAIQHRSSVSSIQKRKSASRGPATSPLLTKGVTRISSDTMN